MASDDDKTIYNPARGDLTVDPNATIVIPNPGGRLRHEERNQAQIPAAEVPHATPPGESRQRVNIKQNLDGQANPFLSASNTLIAVLCALSNSTAHPNVAQLQQELSTEITNFDARLRASRVSPEEALTARYILCTAIDEAVMNTPWGVDSGWGQRSLLRIYHNEANGGERFFSLLDQLLARPKEFRDLLELFHVLLCMGFKGKYDLISNAEYHLDTIRERVYQELYGSISFERLLSVSANAADVARPKLRNRIPLWIVLSVSLALALIVYTGLRAWMYAGTVDVTNSFDDIYSIEQTDS